MMQIADVSIQIIHKKTMKKKIKRIYRIANFGDFHISDLTQLKHLFLRDGKGNYYFFFFFLY